VAKTALFATGNKGAVSEKLPQAIFSSELE